MKITDFFNTDYVDQASYDNLRKIASLMDGQKNASRKILYTILDKNIKNEIKVSQLGSKVAEFAEYLHGNLDNVIVNLAQNFPGTNNTPLLVREGNFGTRFSQEASASRYIYTNGSDDLFNLFRKEDNDILIKQFFEGEKIEPMFYVPNLPILLTNGSEGVSSGFAQKILPRDASKLKNFIANKLQGKQSRYDFTPHYEGFNGTICQGDNPSQWLIKGVATRKGVNKVTITEVPIGYDLKGYINILDDLEDKKIIQSYRDKSENDKFEFEVSIPSKTLSAWDDDTLLEKLKLVKKVTENYTVINEHNKIEVFESVKDIAERYIAVKLEYMEKRKLNECSKIEDDIRFDYSKYLFVKNVIDEKIIVNKRTKVQIVADICKIENIIERDGSYNYLLNMPIYSLSKDKMDELENSIKDKKSKLDTLKKTSIEDLWIGEL